MDILERILYDFESFDLPIDIESITKSFWIEIIKTDLWNIDWILFNDTIWVNSWLSEYKQRFVIAHEFCHFLLWEKWFSKWIFHCKDPKEKRADNFATKILIPEKQIIEYYEEYWNIPTLTHLFWVPDKVIEERLKYLILKDNK